MVLQGRKSYGSDFQAVEEPGLVEREDTPDERLIFGTQGLTVCGGPSEMEDTFLTTRPPMLCATKMIGSCRT